MRRTLFVIAALLAAVAAAPAFGAVLGTVLGRTAVSFNIPMFYGEKNERYEAGLEVKFHGHSDPSATPVLYQTSKDGLTVPKVDGYNNADLDCAAYLPEFRYIVGTIVVKDLPLEEFDITFVAYLNGKRVNVVRTKPNTEEGESFLASWMAKVTIPSSDLHDGTNTFRLQVEHLASKKGKRYFIFNEKMSRVPIKDVFTLTFETVKPKKWLDKFISDRAAAFGLDPKCGFMENGLRLADERLERERLERLANFRQFARQQYLLQNGVTFWYREPVPGDVDPTIGQLLAELAALKARLAQAGSSDELGRLRAKVFDLEQRISVLVAENEKLQTGQQASPASLANELVDFTITVSNHSSLRGRYAIVIETGVEERRVLIVQASITIRLPQGKYQGRREEWKDGRWCPGTKRHTITVSPEYTSEDFTL